MVFAPAAPMRRAEGVKRPLRVGVACRWSPIFAWQGAVSRREGRSGAHAALCLGRNRAAFTVCAPKRPFFLSSP